MRVGCCAQTVTLIRRKELPQRRVQIRSTLCSILLPVALTSLVVLGTKLSDSDHGGDISLAPQTLSVANLTGMDFFQQMFANITDLVTYKKVSLGYVASLRKSGTSEYDQLAGVPAVVPPLATFLSASQIASTVLSTISADGFPPFDGSVLAIAPNTSEVRRLVARVLAAPGMPPHVEWPKQPASSVAGFVVRYYKDAAGVEDDARAGAPIWACASFLTTPPKANWSYALRFPSSINGTSPPQTTKLVDKFSPGVSSSWVPYYGTGFLSLQTAVDDAIFTDVTGEAAPAPVTYGAPYPVPAYTYNVFFDHAGSLIGLVVVLSFLIPLSTMLRAIVLERESKMREQLLMMGTGLPAYYSSLALVHISTFFLIAVFAASVTIFGGTFVYSSPAIVLVFFVAFALAAVAFAAALSPFFKNAKVAAIVGPLLLFISAQFINFFTNQKGILEEEGNVQGKALASLFPATAFYLGANVLALYEGAGIGVTHDNLFDGDFPLGASIFLLFFDTLLYAFLAWYLDQVVPSEFGLQRPFYFLCMPSYWCSSTRPTGADARRIVAADGTVTPLGKPLLDAIADTDDAQDTSTHAPICVEPEPPLNGHEGVQIERLRKVFSRGPNNGVAVAGLELRMRPGQITSLLGANGAGKTTTISMLTGLIPPTSGTAWIGPHSIRLDMDVIRQSLGVCPQQNVIYFELSPYAHLVLYGELKGMRGAELHAAIAAILPRVGLAERATVKAAALSGGQKRKLCLAIALLSTPHTVFLDEPTSGMDPHSRRSIWALLREQREGRTLVLTTHFLDEAEILSDRIAIMAEGRLRCVGSPLYLKARLGCGYRLTFAKKQLGSSQALAALDADGKSLELPAFKRDGVLALLRQYVPNCELTVDDRFTAEVSLPQESLDAYPALFAALDQQLASLGVSEYGVTCTTLEDVFLRINENNLLRLEAVNAAATATAQTPAASGLPPPDPEAAAVAAAIDADDLAPTYGAAHAPTTTPRRAARPYMPSRCEQFAGLVKKRRLQAQRDLCTACTQLLAPVLLVLAALALLSKTFPAGPALALSPQEVFGPKVVLPPGMLMPNASGYAGHATTLLAPQLESTGWAPDTTLVGYEPSDAEFPGFPIAVNDYLLGPSSQRRSSAEWANITRTSPVAVAVTSESDLEVDAVLFESKQTHALPTALAALHDAKLRAATAGNASLSVFAHPLPRTDTDTAKISALLSVLATILILVPFSFVAASFVTPLVRERESGSKDMQFVSGIGAATYWLASWAWDVVLLCAVNAATLLVFALMNRQEFTGTAEAFWSTTLLLFAFGVAAIGVASASSFAFTSPSASLIVLIAFHFISGFGLLVTDFILLTIGGSTSEIDTHLRAGLFPLFPAYCLGRGFFVLSTRSAFNTLAGSGAGSFVTIEPLYSWGQLGAPLFFLFAEAVFTWTLTLILQVLSSYPRLWLSIQAYVLRLLGYAPAPSSISNPSSSHTVEPLPSAASSASALPDLSAMPGGGMPGGGLRASLSLKELEDDSVMEERRAVDAMPQGGAGLAAHDASGSSGPLAEEAELVLMHLRKQYGGGKLAVRDLCLRVQAGECFGFLGVNGAGKSTTFGMLTGAVTPSSGDALLRGMSILNEQDAIRRLVGFCPQHDALESLLTAGETLELYARIKGVPADEIGAEVDGLLADLDLGMFREKQAGTLSGGNKRKLCVGIALIGNPQLVLLDEPSSGMDAASKRFLWSVIKRRTANCCTILTTHSMEECEALCSRLGVMVDGSLRCLGPIQTLKTKYGQGYKLDLRLPATVTDASDVIAFVERACPGAKLEELEMPCITMTIPQRDQPLAHIFSRLDEARKHFGVLESSLTQCTLEQIFVLMASRQQLRSQQAEETAETEAPPYAPSEPQVAVMVQAAQASSSTDVPMGVPAHYGVPAAPPGVPVRPQPVD